MRDKKNNNVLELLSVYLKDECTDKKKRARKKREVETSLYSLALYNAQRSHLTKLSLATLLIADREFCYGILLKKAIILSAISSW